MGKKRDELVDGCFAKAADDEPLFVLRAHDKSAPGLVRQWAHSHEKRNGPNPKSDEARKLADEMEAWPNRKWPD